MFKIAIFIIQLRRLGQKYLSVHTLIDFGQI